MDQKNPLVTIITPVYNRADLVEETIQSVLSQDYPNIEYILLDDGSRDNSWDILQTYKDRATLERHANMGETQTVNKGLSMAKGEIIGIVNSDDPLLPGAVSKIVRQFLTHPEVSVVYPDWKKIDGKGFVFEEVKTPDYDYEYILKNFHCVPGPGTFFRASLAKKLGGRDARFKYVADFDFWLRAGLLEPFCRLSETLATFRVHGGSASASSLRNEMPQEHIDLAKKIYAMPDFPRRYKKFKNDTFSSAYFLAWWFSAKKNSFQAMKFLLLSFVYNPKRYLAIVKDRSLKPAKRAIKKICLPRNRK
jgi:glycosyltransferase involved in cell wall biosynthesis